MDTTNGGLHFDITANQEQLEQQINEARKNILGLSDDAQDAGKQIDEAFDKVKPVVEPKIDAEKAVADAGNTAEVIQEAIDKVKPEITPKIDTEKAVAEAEKTAEIIEKTLDKNTTVSIEIPSQPVIAEAENTAKLIDEALDKVNPNFDYADELAKAMKEVGLQSNLTGKEMKNAIQDAEDFVKGMEDGLKAVISYQEKLLSEIEKTPEGAGRTALLEEYTAIGEKIESVSQTIEMGRGIIDNYKEENASLAVKLRDVKAEMEQLIQLGQRDSEKYETLKQKAHEYQEAISQLNADMKSLEGNQGLNALISTLGFASGAFATAQGVMAMFAGENEDLEKIMVRLQSAMSVAIGLQEIQNQLSKEGAFNVQVIAKAKEWWAAANTRTAFTIGGLTVSVGALTIALTAGLAAAVIGVIYILDRFNNKMKLQQDINKAVANSVAEPLLAYRNLQSQWNAFGNDLAAKRKFVEENKDSFKKLGVSVDNVSAAENIFVKNSTAMVASMMLRARAAAAMQIATEQYKKGLEIQMNYKNEEKILKNGSVTDKMAVRHNRNVRELKGESIDGKEEISGANSTIQKSVGYGNAADSLAKKNNIHLSSAITKEKSNKQQLINLRKEHKENTAEYKSILKDAQDEQKILDEINEEIKPKKKKQKDEDSLSKILGDKKERLQKLRAAGKENTSEYKKLLAETKKMAVNDDIKPPKPKKQEDSSLSKELSEKKKKLQELTLAGKTETAEYKKILGEAQKLEAAIKKTDTDLNASPAQSAEGLRQRLQSITSLLAKSTDEAVIAKLREKALKTMSELAEAEKKIAVRSFDEQVDFMKKQFDLRDKMLQQGTPKERVDSLFPEIKDKSYIHYLQDTEKSLSAIREPSAEVSEHLTKIKGALAEYRGEKTFIDSIGEKIDRLKEKFSGTRLIEELDKLEKMNMPISEGGYTDDQKNTLAILVQKAREEELKRQQQFYANLLKEQETFEDESLKLNQRYDDAKALARNDAERKKIESARKQALAELNSKQFQKSDLYVRAFGDIEKTGIRSLIKLRDALKQYLSTEKNLKPETIKAVQEQIFKIEDLVGNKNPFANITFRIDEYKKKLKELDEAKKEGSKTDQQLADMQEDVNISFAGIVEAAGAAANAMIDFVENAGDAFGGLSDETKETLNEVQTLITGIVNIVAGYFSGNYAQMISGIIQVIGALVKILNGDKRRERQIKSWEAAVTDLKTSYDRLGQSIKTALGEGAYDIQIEQIKNLQLQQQKLLEMRDKEREKKKSDKNKVADYNSQISQIGNQIEDLYGSIAQSVAQTNAKDLAGNISDALTDAFSKGEDAAEAYEKKVEDVMRSAVKNALKMQILEPAMQGVVDKLRYSMGFGSPDAEKKINAQIAEAEKKLDDLNKSGYSGLAGESLKEAQKKKLQDQINSLRAELAKASGSGSFDGLTEKEREEIKALGQNAMQQYTLALQQYQDLFGDAQKNAQGLKGDIKGVSEKTAGALEAQINAMRTNQVSGIEVMRNQLLQLSQIEFNTRRLHNMDKNLEELNKKTTGKLAGIG